MSLLNSGSKVGNPASKLVLMFIDYSVKSGNDVLSYEEIASKCEMTRRSAIRHVGILCKSGRVKKVSSGREGNRYSVK